MTDPTVSVADSRRPARWKWYLALGVLLLLLGLAGSGATAFLELSSLLLFGPLLLASSLFQFLIAFFSDEGRERYLHLVAAAPEAVLGFLIMVHPLVVVTDLIVLVAILLMVAGGARLIRALATHTPGRSWTAVAGVAALILGVCVWLKLPVNKLWLVGLFIAIDFVCHGASWMAIALLQKKPLPWESAWEAQSVDKAV